MRTFKNTLFVTFIFLSLSSCDNGEETISPTPTIDFKDLEFIQAEAGATLLPDTLKLTIGFSDGEFDLGLDYDQDPPYHQFYFFARSSGTTSQLESRVEGDYLFVIPPEGQGQKLLTYRKALDYGLNPPEFSCYNYLSIGDVLVPIDPISMIDASYNIIDTIKINSTNCAILRDTLLIERNPNYYNIDVDFFVEQTDGSYVEFDFQKSYCASFDGRFPSLIGMQPFREIKSGPFVVNSLSSESGILTYNMMSIGFKYLFSGKRIKLRTRIRDRALNVSNEIETPPITIE